jgi:integrase/recombinase XerD
MKKRITTRKYVRTGKVVTPEQTESTIAMDDMFEEFMILKRGEGLARRTLEGYYQNYDYFSRYAGENLTRADMTLELFIGWISYMRDELDFSPHTINIRVRTMRAFLRFCYEEKGWITEPIHRRFKPQKAPVDVVEAFSTEEVKRMIGALDDRQYTQFRTKLQVFMLLDTMARGGELLAIKRNNIDFNKLHIYLEAEDTKVRSGRFVPISIRTAKLLKEYLDETEEFGSEFLFVSYEGEPLGYTTLRDSLKVLGRIAGIYDKRVSPHTFRHTGALFYIMNGGDPFSLQKILGHSHMNMVRRYVQMTDMDVQNKHATHSPLNYVFK